MSDQYSADEIATQAAVTKMTTDIQTLESQLAAETAKDATDEATIAALQAQIAALKATPTPAPTPAPTPTGVGRIVFGAYASATSGGFADSGRTEDFLTAIGAVPAHSVMMCFADGSSWANAMTQINGGYSDLLSFPGDKCLAIPLVANGGTWTDVTGGSQDSYYTKVATYCHANGVRKIRMGWEFQGGMPWSNNLTPANFLGAWSHIYNLFQGVATGFFQFIFNPNCGVSGWLPTWEQYYPIGQCQIIALDEYAGSQPFISYQTDNPPALDDITSVAKSDGLMLAIPETSCTPGGTSWGSGDRPDFFVSLMAWATAQATAGMTVHIWPWADNYPTPDTWGLQTYPNSFAQFKIWVAEAIAAGLA